MSRYPFSQLARAQRHDPAGFEHDLFPKYWQDTLEAAAFPEFLDEIGGASTRMPSAGRVAVTVSRQGVGLDYWADRERLAALVEQDEPEGPWNVREADLVCLLWQAPRIGIDPPDGFLCFNVGRIDESEQGDAMVGLSAVLVWVRPRLRGKGVGKLLVFALCRYLASCPVRPPLVAREGIGLAYYADLDSQGGERLSDLLETWFAEQAKRWAERSNKRNEPALWSVNSFSAEVGW